MSNDFLPIGSLVKAKIQFTHAETGESLEPQTRPLLVLRDYGDGAVKVATITSRIDKKHVEKYGHIMENSLDYGLTKKSAVLCTRANMGILARENLSEPFGRLPFEEVKQVLQKAEQLNKKEHGLAYKLKSELER